LQWLEWAERMTKTHRQERCPDCGLWEIWVPKEASPVTDYPPASTQPCIGADPTCPCQDGDPCHYRDDPVSGTKAWPIPASTSQAGSTEADYDLALDPRCLWGWGGCGHCFGHACFRPYRHDGRCWDAGDKPARGDRKCMTSQRPEDWDEQGRAEANA